jgi:ATP-dependent DNA helicase 2 subunit 2
MKTTKSVLMGTVLRIGDVEGRPQEAAEILVKSSKCTALARPKGWKKFGRRIGGEDDDMGGDDEEEERKTAYAQLTMRTEYFVDRAEHDEDEEAAVDKDEDAMDVDEDGENKQTAKEENIERVEKEQLVRGFKYGTTYVPCPDGQFPKLNSVKGIDICGFFSAENVHIPSHALLLKTLLINTPHTVPP